MCCRGATAAGDIPDMAGDIITLTGTVTTMAGEMVTIMPGAADTIIPTPTGIT